MNLEQVKEKMQKSIDTRFERYSFKRTKCPTLKTMSKYINEKFPYYKAEIVKGFDCKEIKPQGSRKVTRRTSYYGNKLVVYDTRIKAKNIFNPENIIFQHNSVETYRHNTEVAEWILKMEKKDV